MPAPLAIGAAATAGAGLIGASKQASAAKSASQAQSASAEASIEEQRRQFDHIQELLAPFVDSGSKAQTALMDLAGFNSAETQRAAVEGIESSPEFQIRMKQGEDAILANASATGGLRGGNTQSALAQFRPQLLADQINKQYARLGGIAAAGQSAAVGEANAAQGLGATVSNTLQQQGAAIAGGHLATGQAWQNGIGAVGQGIGMIAGGFQQPNGGVFTSRSGF